VRIIVGSAHPNCRSSAPLLSRICGLPPPPCPPHSLCIPPFRLRAPGANATAPTPCGGDEYYCPQNSSTPTQAPPGFVTRGVGGPTLRSSVALCPQGQWCLNGTARDCPAGRYGDAQGLYNATCSGQCQDGALCIPGSTSAAGTLCPTGSFCVAGDATPCPRGTYNPVGGAPNASACLLCPGGTFNPTNGSSSITACAACPQYEGSSPGSALCWPGLRGAAYSSWGLCLSLLSFHLQTAVSRLHPRVRFPSQCSGLKSGPTVPHTVLDSVNHEHVQMCMHWRHL
jgi:hypothetical protein